MNFPAVPVRPACKECQRYRNHLGAILQELQAVDVGRQDPQTALAAIANRLRLLQLSPHGPEGLHDALDLLVAEFVRTHTGKSLEQVSVLQLLVWSGDRALGVSNPGHYNVPEWNLGQRRVVFDAREGYAASARPKNSITTFVEFRGRKAFMYPILSLLLFLAGLSVYFLVKH